MFYKPETRSEISCNFSNKKYVTFDQWQLPKIYLCEANYIYLYFYINICRNVQALVYLAKYF